MRQARAAFACTAAACLTLLAACTDLPTTGPLRRVRTQDADAILQTATLRDPNQPLRVFLGAPPSGASPRVAALLAPASTPVAAPAPASVVPLAAMPEVRPVSAPAPATARDDAPPAWGELQQALEAWRRAWEAGDADAYLRHYDSSFHGDAGSRAAWERQRRQRLANGHIRVQFAGLQLVNLAGDRASVQFVQHYTSGRHHDTGTKQLVLQRRGTQWQIVQEHWRPGA